MINVTYNRKHLRITAEGHANFGAVGSDIVCSAASILLYTLENALEHEGYGVNADFTPNTAAYVEAIGTHKGKARVLFDAIYGGYAMLAATYPENVSVKEQG